VASRVPLPLDRPAELVGEWWRPGAPAEVASGRLIYEPDGGLRLETVSGGRLLEIDDPCPWLHGLTVDGRFVTLRELHVQHQSVSMPGGILTRARVREAFVGTYAASEAELRLHALEARITNLTPWLDLPGFVVSPHFPSTGAVEVKPGGVVGLGRAPGGVLATGWVNVISDARPQRQPLRLNLEQQGWCRFAARRQLPYDVLRDHLMTFREFLSLAAGADSPLLELRGQATVVRETFGGGRKTRSREPVWVLFERREPAEVEETEAEAMLFRRSDATFKDFLPFVRWFRRAKLMEPVYDVYVAALPPRAMFLESKFLAFAQALEVYDFRRTHQERKLRKMVQTAVDELPIGVRRLVPAGFAELVRDTRHYLTHYNPKYGKRAAQGARLYAAMRAMKLLFELTMLLELGFGKRAIQTLVENNGRLAADIQLGFESL
jgi:hypothetical protein